MDGGLDGRFLGSHGSGCRHTWLQPPPGLGPWVLPSNRPATPLFSPACWELGFQAWAQSTCPELSAQARASSAKTRGFHTQLDEGPETP